MAVARGTRKLHLLLLFVSVKTSLLRSSSPVFSFFHSSAVRFLKAVYRCRNSQWLGEEDSDSETDSVVSHFKRSPILFVFPHFILSAPHTSTHRSPLILLLPCTAIAISSLMASEWDALKQRDAADHREVQ